MSGAPFECGYGAIVREDVEVLEECLSEGLYAYRRTPEEAAKPFKVLEIGMHDGGTARGIERFVESYGRPLEYYGIDVDLGLSRPRYIPGGGRVIIGDSAEVFDQVPSGLDLVWVDGCHCMNHVLLDTIHFSPKVAQGGFMLFHDINPAGRGEEHQYHGPVIPEFGLATHLAHAAIGFPNSLAWPGWLHFMTRYPNDRINCGTTAYRFKL